MTPSLFDPQNHAPEVSPDDDWGDPQSLENPAETPLPLARLLPEPRKMPAERAGAEIALRIEPRIGGSPGREGSANRLEINRFGGEVVRLEAVPDAPLPVPKQVIPPPPDGQEPADHPPEPAASRAWGGSSTRSWQWFAGASAVAIMGLIFALNQAGNRTEETPATITLPPVVEAPVPAPVGRTSVTEECAGEAREILTRYARATTPDEVLPLIRNAERLAARAAADWQAWAVPLDWRPAAEASWSTDGPPGREFGVIAGSLPDGSPYRAYFVRTGAGRLQLDWEATAGLGEATFSELVAGRTGGTIRAGLQAADFHTAALPEDAYHCFKLTSPYSPHAIWGYAARDSRAGKTLAGLGTNGASREWAVTVRLERPPPGGMPQQWVIADLAHLEWVDPE